MSNDIGIILIYAAGLSLALVFLCYPSRPDRDFVRLSIFFMIAFLILPAALCTQDTEFIYLGRIFEGYSGAWLFMGLSIWSFLAGFFFRDFILTTSSNCRVTGICQSRANRPTGQVMERRRALAFILFALIARFVVWQIHPSAKEEYAIRIGLADGSHVDLFLNILFGSVYFSAIFISARFNLRLVTIGLLLGLIFFTFTGSPGRFNAALAFVLLAIYVFSLPVSRLTLFLPIIIFLAFPILANGKLLIFAAVTGSRFPTIPEMFLTATALDSYLGNFAHPMVSLYQIDKLLNTANIRWFYDFPQGLLFYTRVLGFDPGQSLTYYNTEAFLGYPASIIPTGYLAFGYAQLSYFGVFVMGLFYRSLYYFFRSKRYIRANLSPILSFYIALTTANTFYTGEFRTLLLQFFLNVIVLNFCFWLVSKPQKSSSLAQEGGRGE